MTPTTRSSSAANSPTSAKSGSANQSPNTTPTRKPPHCRTCRRPMQGHRKSSCTPSSISGTTGEELSGLEDLPKNLKAMSIASSEFLRDREEENKAFIRDRRRKSAAAAALVPNDTILSLSSSSNEIMSRLLQPGIFDDAARGEDAQDTSNIIRWKETLVSNRPTKRTKLRQLMPCTLVSPSPDSSILFQSIDSIQKIESPDTTTKLSLPPKSSTQQTTPSVSGRSSLSRTMSEDQRIDFLSMLGDHSSATVHVIAKVDVEMIRSQAGSLKFITHLVMDDNMDDSHVLLVLGRDEVAVKDLVRKIEEENGKRAGKSTLTPNFKAIAGAAVVGAVGTWAGLAFS